MEKRWGREERRLNIFIDPEIKRKAKATAFLEGISLSQMIENLLKKKLENHNETT